MANKTYLTQPTKVFSWASGSAHPVNVGEVTYVSGVGFVFMQDDGEAVIKSGSLNATDHSGLRQLVHLAEEGGPFEGFPNVVRDVGPMGSPFPTASIWWTDATRSQKIVEKIVMRNANKTPATIQWKVYVSGSNVVATSVTDTVTYANGVFEASRTRSTP